MGDEVLHQAAPILLWDRPAREADVHLRAGRGGPDPRPSQWPRYPEHFLKTIAAYREDLVVAVECIFTWYWLADLCAQEGIAFVLGHALYMKAIHGGKAKNDRRSLRQPVLDPFAVECDPAA